MGSKVHTFLHTHKSLVRIMSLSKPVHGRQMDYKPLIVILLDRNCFFMKLICNLYYSFNQLSKTVMTIYVGNINYSLTEDDIRKIFEVMGKVESVKIVQDKRSGRSKGYGFIEMPDKKEAMEAIKTLDGKEVSGRNLRVLKAHTTKKVEEEIKTESIQE